MTVVVINKNYIEISGHSGYAPIGYDIVCAAISTLSINTANCLQATGNDVKILTDNGYMIIHLEKINKTGKRIIKCFEKELEDIITDYPKYIRRKK